MSDHHVPRAGPRLMANSGRTVDGSTETRPFPSSMSGSSPFPPSLASKILPMPSCPRRSRTRPGASFENVLLLARRPSRVDEALGAVDHLQAIGGGL
eukprot:1949547-Prymnesium_polylepis.1